MGAVSFSIDPSLVSELKKVLPLETFVETGTFEGDTVEKVLNLFDSVYSVELSEEYYRKVAERFRNRSNVFISHGPSPEFLQNLKPKLAGISVLYWLDAHWCVADKTAGGTSQCPLLEELDAIGTLGAQSVVVIDDARLFLCPPPFPHEVAHWPRLDRVLQKLSALDKEHEIAIANDVIIFFPAAARAAVERYAYEHSVNWLTVLDKSRDYDALLTQLKEKERELEASVEKDKEIDRLKAAAEERAKVIESSNDQLVEKDQEISRLLSVAEERLRVGEERLRVINLINQELEGIKNHWAYRFAARIKRLL
jgi:hypothetical protein